MKFLKLPIILLLLVCVTNLSAAVKLPNIFTSNMVLQRDKPIKIWGLAEKGESVTVKFYGQQLKTTASKNGSWMVVLKPMAFGGPFDLIVQGKRNEVILKNILIGDVWICSGQSNMGMSVNGSLNAPFEIAAANFPNIRLLTVSADISNKTQTDVPESQWQICSPQTIGNFSAAAYFFGRDLHRDLNIPIGLINSSVGGTNIEAWMSNESIRNYPEYTEKIEQSLSPGFEEQINKSLKANSDWRVAMDQDKKNFPEWIKEGKLLGGNDRMELPQRWEDKLMPGIDGIVWFQKEIVLSEEEASEDIVVNLCLVDDGEETYWNGSLIGATDGYNKPRNYKLDKRIAKPGRNIISIKVTDSGGSGGIRGKAEDFFYQVKDKKYSLCGEWFYKPWIVKDSRLDISANNFPSLLYNSKINPLTQLPVKGVIWYQGESNVSNAYRYRDLLKSMITDWRSKWGLGNFPFLVVQLANCGKTPDGPADSEWAKLREAQSMALELPKTGMAVAIDIGEADDIHPKNKQEVGRRLALAALKVAYNKDLVYSGPVYKSMEVDEDRILLSFNNIGSGLKCCDKYGYLKGFCIAGKDQKFVWAKAFVEGDKVVVYSPLLKNPVAVRYGWADNPGDVNLFNNEGLPASPFRTDNWK